MTVMVVTINSENNANNTAVMRMLNTWSLCFNKWAELIKRNSSGDEIANVNFLYDDIVHVLQNTIDSCINSATDQHGGCGGTYVYQIQ